MRFGISRPSTSKSGGNAGSRGSRGIDNSGSADCVDSEFETFAIAPDDSTFGDEDKSAKSGNVGSKEKSDGMTGRTSKDGK